jgi:hypothetical protein
VGPFAQANNIIDRYLEEDPSVTVLERKRRLEGYELYLVEQWACSRVHPTFVIATYTGDPKQTVSVGVLGVPTDEEAWSPRLRVYIKAVSQFHARKKETPLGTMMITNLSGFPSSLNVILVSSGDIKSHREDFAVNENLKRLGCSGRAGLTLSPPAAATQAMFINLYKTSDRIPFYNAVIELVKLCQTALTMFGTLAQEYGDGLLCDVTEMAINDWWTEFGTEHYNVEPSDGILGPTTVAALLGLFLGARSRLSAYGAPVAKDVFDIGNLKRGIAYFQKSQKIHRSRRLDRQTLDRLHRVTAKAANNGEGWRVQKAVKSTVAELSGKGGEMVMGMVGARDKAAISDIETIDMEQFVQLVSGERAKWLWYGKPRKSTTSETTGLAVGDQHLVFERDEQDGYVWSNQKRDSFTEDEHNFDTQRRDTGASSVYSAQPPESMASIEGYGDGEQHLRKTMFKSVAGRMSDARSGFGRIKDAVGISGLRGHHHKPSKEESLSELQSSRAEIRNQPVPERVLSPVRATPPSSPVSILGNQTPNNNNNNNEIPLLAEVSETAQGQDQEAAATSKSVEEGELDNSRSSSQLPKDEGQSNNELVVPNQEKLNSTTDGPRENDVTTDPSVDGSIYRGGRDEETFEKLKPKGKAIGMLLRRRQSQSDVEKDRLYHRTDNWCSRHLSFGDAEEAILRWKSITWGPEDILLDNGDDLEALERQKKIAVEARRVRQAIAKLDNQVESWVDMKVTAVEDMNASLVRDQQQILAFYYQKYEDYENLQSGSTDLLTNERNALREAIKEIDILSAKLDYELDALAAKVEDVEDGVAEFETQVLDVELRTQDLEPRDGGRYTWAQWALTKVRGAGRPPTFVWNMMG